MKKLLYAVAILLLLLASVCQILDVGGFYIRPLIGLVGLAIGVWATFIDTRK